MHAGATVLINAVAAMGCLTPKGAKYGLSCKAGTAAVPLNTWSCGGRKNKRTLSALRAVPRFFSVRVNFPTQNFEETIMCMVVECMSCVFTRD